MPQRAALPELDWLNFFLADVQGGLGPFLAIFLMSSRHWDAGRIGIVLTIGGIATVAARGPAGALVDATRWKRGLVAAGAVIVAASAVAMALAPHFWIVVLSQIASGGADAVFPSAIAAISLGIVGRRAFTRRVGRNEAFNHAGNAATAIGSGLLGYLIAPSMVLWMVAGLGGCAALAVARIDPRRIDHQRARGADAGDPAQGQGPSGLAVIFACRPLLLFTAAITLFHFANAAMLPLLGEELSRNHRQAGPLFMAACIITAQIVMVPMAMLVGRKADAWGRKPLFLAGFAALPIRGLLYTLWQDPYYLISIQILDGVGAGIFGALFFIVVADLTRGSGHYNLAQGAASASWGLGAALSNGVAGMIAARLGFSAAFLALSALALAAFLLFWRAVPETRPALAGEAGASDRPPLELA